MRPQNLKTRIFLDGGDPRETREIIKLLGFLDGQTTNPTLIAKNPDAETRIARGEQFSEEEIYEFYKKVVQELSPMIRDGSISIEVYADKNTTAEAMLAQGRRFFTWIPNAHIKFPTTSEGLKAAETAVKEGLRVNMTLCFTQGQAAAVYAATRGARKGQVFISPFVGRLDDIGEDGMSLIRNIIQMYSDGDGHVQVLTASVRTLEHFFYALALKSDIITVPVKILREWASGGMKVPDPTYAYNAGKLKPIVYAHLDLDQPWQKFDIAHRLTDAGVRKFAEDWNALIHK